MIQIVNQDGRKGLPLFLDLLANCVKLYSLQEFQVVTTSMLITLTATGNRMLTLPHRGHYRRQ